MLIRKYVVDIHNIQFHAILITVESGYLAHAPNETTTAAYAPDNETRGLASSTLLTPPPNFDIPRVDVT